MPSNFTRSSFRFVVTSLILVAFLAVVFFSLPAMADHKTGTMSDPCLFPITGVALCAGNGSAMLFHHIASYQSFLNVPISFLGLAIWLILLALALIIGLRRPRDATPPESRFLNRYKPNQSWRSQPGRFRLRRWLSFLINSPTLV